MKKIYANLIGNWIDITDSGKIENQEPQTFIEEQLCYQDGSSSAKCFEFDYINIQYNNANYRIHPSQIQIVTK